MDILTIIIDLYKKYTIFGVTREVTFLCFMEKHRKRISTVSLCGKRQEAPISELSRKKQSGNKTLDSEQVFCYNIGQTGNICDHSKRTCFLRTP